jgi:hypothetical protein
MAHVACLGTMRNAHNIFVGSSEERRPLRRSKHRGEHVKIYLKVYRLQIEFSWFSTETDNLLM